MSLTCILIDDEPKALTSLRYELQRLEGRIQPVASFMQPRKAIAFLKTTPVDLVFLDINMPGMNGLAFLDNFPDRTFEVVFTTAHSEYAIEAFKKAAIGYLMKPIEADELEAVIQRAERLIVSENIYYKIEEALDRFNKLCKGSKKIKLALEKRLVLIDPNEVVYCESDGNYCKIILDNGKEFLISQKLKQISELLPEDQFFRIHNSYLINLEKVQEFHRNDGYILMKGEIQIPVSRQKKQEFMEKL